MFYNTTTEKKYNTFKKGQIKQLLCDKKYIRYANMNLKWNLTNLLSDNKSFYKEIQRIKKLLNNLKKYKTITLDNESLLNNQYIKFLSSESSMYSLDLLKMLNIDLTNKDIITNGFKVLEKDIKN